MREVLLHTDFIYEPHQFQSQLNIRDFRKIINAMKIKDIRATFREHPLTSSKGCVKAIWTSPKLFWTFRRARYLCQVPLKKNLSFTLIDFWPTIFGTLRFLEHFIF